MAYKFPSEAWLLALKDVLNQDQQYARIARNWEGDMMFHVEAGGPLLAPVEMYLDLWHGQCRRAFEVTPENREGLEPAFILSASYENLKRVLKGELDPMQAMISRKLKVQGSMAYMMRNVPTVLEFVRCAKAVPADFIP
ncbi:MAG: SCP2 sterol-binding domain-containing protein [Anaerolineales bacterium]|nr:SCP2 sterol-binding domain-containing protein [Anaerolineales bacterium]